MADEPSIDTSRDHLLTERAPSRTQQLAEDATARERLHALGDK